MDEQLSVAKAEIAKLQRQVQERGFAETLKGAAVDVKHKTVDQVEGYQLTVVVAVAVASFAMGYAYHGWS